LFSRDEKDDEMFDDLPTAGVASPAVSRQAHAEWLDAARQAGVDLTGFDPDAPLPRRLALAKAAGLVIATIYTRFSTKGQHSTADQIRACVLHAARNGMYTPPELICVDEAAKGRRVRRDGLGRVRAILAAKAAAVLLVFKVSRLFRVAWMGYQLVQQEVVEAGLRAVSVSQGIDTADKKLWKALLYLHGLLDDILIDTISDGVREGLIGLFNQGYSIGSPPLGYDAVPVPGAPPTKRGTPRTMPAVNPELAARIRQHYEWCRDGLPLAEGLRRWRAAGGPADPRSTTGKMSKPAYRRMLERLKYTGRWEFGRTRSRWNTKKDYVVQEPQPENTVLMRQCEELRIVSDELFAAVQRKLAERQTGPRPPRAKRVPRLWELLTDVFHCSRCDRRHHVVGSNVPRMRCPNLDCPAKAMVDREKAVAAVCRALTDLFQSDLGLINRVVSATRALDVATPDDRDRRLAELATRDRKLTTAIDDLIDLAGEGSDADRVELKARIRAAQTERAGVRDELARLRSAAARPPVTAEAVRAVLADVGALLGDAADLGEDAVYRAADLFRRLVGGKVWVDVEIRTNRKRGVVRARFTPALLAVAGELVGAAGVGPAEPSAEVVIWLRTPPRLDAKAADARRLYEDERLPFTEVGRRLGMAHADAYRAYLRYYEMQGRPAPPRRPRGARKQGQ
jgi:site-specific DNA recombinase